jgi:hypothetical protein
MFNEMLIFQHIKYVAAVFGAAFHHFALVRNLSIRTLKTRLNCCLY